MTVYYTDLHIHIGRTREGQAVKITGSRTLTLQSILEAAAGRKGLDIIGIIDCHSPGVYTELDEMLASGTMTEQEGGGLRYGQTLLIPGSEIEIYDENCHGPIHVLAYFPTLQAMKAFSQWMSIRLKNIHLSSQRIYCTGRELQHQVKEFGGLFVPAHVFTPFKSMYGKGVRSSLAEVFDPSLIDAVELGLSADTAMAEKIPELDDYVFLTNSDAHSVGKMAREYQAVELAEPSFNELVMALKEQSGRRVAANYGLNPLLGKYYRTVCGKCRHPGDEDDKVCRVCGSSSIIKGVSDRILELAGPQAARKRPPYIHQVPLDFIPGLGPKTYSKLIALFGTEMAIMHSVSREELEKAVPVKTAGLIDLARTGKLSITPGGGGTYGTIAGE